MGCSLEMTRTRSISSHVLINRTEVDPGFGTGRLVGAEPFPS